MVLKSLIYLSLFLFVTWFILWPEIVIPSGPIHRVSVLFLFLTWFILWSVILALSGQIPGAGVSVLSLSSYF